MNSQRRVSGWSPTVMRVALGGIVFIHGIGRLLGIGPAAADGGVAGFAGFLASLGVPFPELMAWVVTLVETVGALMVLVGLLTRYAAALIVIDMAMASLLVHLPNGFVAIPNGGFEFTLALALIGVGLVISGPGRLSLDYALFGRELVPGMRANEDGTRAKSA